jgi:hypothetical protein
MKHLLLAITFFIGSILLISNCSKRNSVGSGKKYKITFQAKPSGAGSISLPNGSYIAGDSLTFRAKPSGGWVFKRWSGDYSDSTNKVATIFVDGPKTITANFGPKLYKLTLDIEGEGSVDISNEDSMSTIKKNITEHISLNLPVDTKLKLTAHSAENSSFEKWNGSVPYPLQESNPLTYTTGTTNEITAVFQKEFAAPKPIKPSGSGSKQDPYKISSLGNLIWISQNSSSWGDYFIQTSDIDAKNTISKQYNDGKGFKPISGNDNDNAFTGSYDGQGHKINNLYINRPNQENIGLFNHLKGATVKNLNLLNADITGASYTGGLVAAAVSGTVISNVSVSGAVTGDHETGGFAGGMWGSEITMSYNNATVIAINGDVDANSVGGISGNFINSTISNVYNTGDVSGNWDVGGIAGWEQNSTIRQTYSTGIIKLNSNKVNNDVGAIIGKVNGGSNTFADNYYNDRTSSTIGQHKGGGISLSSSEMKMQSSFNGFDFSSIWAIDGGSSYPYLQSNTQQPKPGTK